MPERSVVLGPIESKRNINNLLQQPLPTKFSHEIQTSVLNFSIRVGENSVGTRFEPNDLLTD